MGLDMSVSVTLLKGITLSQITGSQSSAKPCHTLLGTAVRKGIRPYPACRLALKFVVTDGAGGIECLFDIPLLQDTKLLLRMVCPDTGIAVCL